VAAGDVDTTIDPVALHHYMSFHAVVPPPHTILQGVRKLPPATIASSRRTGHRATSPTGLDYTRSAAEDRDALRGMARAAGGAAHRGGAPHGGRRAGRRAAVRRRRFEQLIVGLLAEAGQHGLMTFSIGFEEAHGEKGDEFVYSDLIAERFETDHHKIFMPSARLMEALPDTIAAMSEPMVSYDNVGFYLLSQEVAKHIKVVQSGQGADEVFGGYHWYPPLAASNDPVTDYAACSSTASRDRRSAGSCRPNGSPRPT
jgi:asparagine synthase (glutamine-hydrolysing)